MDILHPDPRAEAVARIGTDAVAVLEPSPPAIQTGPWFADDPVGDAIAQHSDALVPFSSGNSWDARVDGDPELETWAADRWLGVWRRLTIAPDRAAFTATRVAWHTLAEHVIAAVRYAANGKIGLRFTREGFGTPYFGTRRQVRVAGQQLVAIDGDQIVTEAITTLAAAAARVGIVAGAPADVFTPTTTPTDEPLLVDAEAARLLGDWFGFGSSVLEELRASTSVVDAPARVQIWPEHFDISVDLGDDSAARRATFGASPGDAEHPLPYLYASPWTPQTSGFWSDHGYASLPLVDFVDAPDQRRAALDFFAAARQALS